MRTTDFSSSKRSSIGNKKPKVSPISYESSESIFSLMKESSRAEPCQVAGVTPILQYPNISGKSEELKSSVFTFANANEVEEEADRQVPTKYVPVDWSLKTKLRILCPTAIQGNGLKISSASGVTRYLPM